MQSSNPFQKPKREIPGLLILIIVLTVLPAVLSPLFRRGQSDSSPLVGKAAPALGFKDTKAVASSLVDFRGKTVLLNFWASWCAPCMAEMDQLRELEAKFYDRGFRIVALNIEERAQDIGSIIRAPNMPRGLYFEAPEAQLQRYSVQSIPQSYLVDAEGILRKHYQGAKDWTGPGITKEIGAFLPTLNN